MWVYVHNMNAVHVTSTEFPCRASPLLNSRPKGFSHVAYRNRHQHGGQAAGLGDILGEYFTASTAAPLLVVWAIAAALHVAVGSVTISAITSAGILAPVAPIIGLDPVLIALAAGAGSLFAVHVTSNTFWLLQSLLGQSTRGALKTVTVGVSVASVVAILLILPMSALF